MIIITIAMVVLPPQAWAILHYMILCYTILYINVLHIYIYMYIC